MERPPWSILKNEPYLKPLQNYGTAFMWPRGVVVSALTSHVRNAGFDSRPG